MNDLKLAFFGHYTCQECGASLSVYADTPRTIVELRSANQWSQANYVVEDVVCPVCDHPITDLDLLELKP